MTETSGIIVTVRDVRAAGLCTRGMRAWLAHHGVDLEAFLRDGAPVERAEAIGDHFALMVCEQARKRWAAAAR
ncbi:MAG: hypothetical protein JSR67_03620 [Proteobacteria bacterium]|nr:hypothetical protein [Pseudomonadota bacterium]